MFTRYSVTSADRFDESLYPIVIKEIDALRQGLFNIGSDHKAAIVISLLKDHCVKTVLLERNRELVRIVQSGQVPAPHLESLFNASRGNTEFVKGLEMYIGLKIG